MNTETTSPIILDILTLIAQGYNDAEIVAELRESWGITELRARTLLHETISDYT